MLKTFGKEADVDIVDRRKLLDSQSSTA